MRKCLSGEQRARRMRPRCERKQVTTWNESGICFKSPNIYQEIVIFAIVNTKLRGIFVPNNNRINRIQQITLLITFQNVITFGK